MTKNFEFSDADQQLVNLALQEDLGLVYRDITTLLLFPDCNDQIRSAQIISKHPDSIIFCGTPVVKAILDAFQQPYEIKHKPKEGGIIDSGQSVLEIAAPANVLLMAERTILNFLRRLCAIATLTRQFVDLVSHTHCKILDTRKTTPGWRHLEKYAVQCGGGGNHRMGLYDAVLIKDTHVDLLGGMDKAIHLLPSKLDVPVIVEVRDEAELAIVLELGREKVDRILLDNMSPKIMERCVELCHGVFKTEASGGLNLSNIKKVAETGVNFASVGMITHSVGQVDLSMTTKR